MSRRVRIGQVVTPEVTPGVIAFFPATQATTSTNVLDASGLGRHGVFGSGLSAAEAATVVGALTTNATTLQDDVLFPSVAAFDYSYDAGDSLLFSCRLKMSAPAANESIFSQAWGTSAPGWDFTIKTATNVLSPRLYHAGGTKFLSDTSIAVVDAAEHTLTYVWFNHDVAAGTADYMAWLDGERAYSTNVTATSCPTTAVPVEIMRIGGKKTGASAYDSAAAQFRAIHFYRCANSVSLNLTMLDDLAMRLHRTPFLPLSPSEWAAE
jgi:hypothetical protein